ncbi:MAG: LuxR C-terminal-related transcriptional regulator [Actinomycetota bacterium]|nr:LuxR C-terminal-related transcriptional regulator [Actinomycetota bacterium]
MKVLVVDARAIGRDGVAACLAALPEVAEVAEAASVEEAIRDGTSADVVLVTSDALSGAVRSAARGADGGACESSPSSRLTAREQEVLRLVAEGHPTREVARRLCYSERTIKNVVHAVSEKLNARTRSQAVAEAVRAGLI